MTSHAPIDRTPAFAALRAHADAMRGRHLRELFRDDPARGTALAHEALGMRMDWSKQRVTDETMRLLAALLDASPFAARRAAMWAGERINVTEDRAVLHVALRAPRGMRIATDGQDVVPGVHAVLDAMAAFADRVRSGAWTGHGGRRIRNVVNIGIGGSDLGPQMADAALRAWATPDMRFRFVSNVDGDDFAWKTAGS